MSGSTLTETPPTRVAWLKGVVGMATGSSTWTPSSSAGKGASLVGVYGTLFLKSGPSSMETWSYELSSSATFAPGTMVTDTFTVRIDDVTVLGTELRRSGVVVRRLGAGESDADTRYSEHEEIVITVSDVDSNTPPTIGIPDPRGLVVYRLIDGDEQLATQEFGDAYWRTNGWSSGLVLPAEWFPAGTSAADRRVAHVGLHEDRGFVEVRLNTSDGTAGPSLSNPEEIQLVITYETTTGQGTLAVQRIGTGSAPDTTEPYRWIPNNSAEVMAAAVALDKQGARVLGIEFNDTRTGKTIVPAGGIYDFTALIPEPAQSYGGRNPRWRTETWTGPKMPRAWATAPGAEFRHTLQRVILRPDGSIELRFGEASAAPSGITFHNPSSIRVVFHYQTLQGVGTLAVQGLQTADNASPFKWTPSNAAEVTAVVNLMARGINATNRMLSINFNNAGRGETRAPEPESAVDSKVVEAGASGSGDPNGSGRFELMDDMFGPTIEARAVTAGDNWVTGSDTANGGDGAKVDGRYGDLFLKADASWTYRLDNERDLTDALATGVTVDDNFQFRAFDGGKYSEIVLVGIKVTGDNDAPVAVDSPERRGGDRGRDLHSGPERLVHRCRGRHTDICLGGHLRWVCCVRHQSDWQ